MNSTARGPSTTVPQTLPARGSQMQGPFNKRKYLDNRTSLNKQKALKRNKAFDMERSLENKKGIDERSSIETSTVKTMVLFTMPKAVS